MVGKEGENFSLLLGVRVGNKGGSSLFFFFCMCWKIIIIICIQDICGRGCLKYTETCLVLCRFCKYFVIVFGKMTKRKCAFSYYHFDFYAYNLVNSKHFFIKLNHFDSD